ncbi:polysaccharide deacetylase family protein [Labilibacter sediminis]|nr:polysaccharide deacetylase family protein [Labilibacter sediminis]
MIQPHSLIKSFFKGATWHEQTSQNEVFVTFDDGPIPDITPWVLNEADMWNAKLTFFCVGENVFKYPEIYQEILRKGHQVGNHTYNHMRGWQHNKETYFKNIDKAADLIDSDLFRPPHGQIYPWYMKPLKDKFKKVVMWDILSFDYNHKLAGEKVFNNVKRNLKPGSIIVFHDSVKAEKNMKYAFPKTMELIAERKYKTSIIK